MRPTIRLNSATAADASFLDAGTEVQRTVDRHISPGCICSKSAAKNLALVAIAISDGACREQASGPLLPLPDAT